MKIEEFISTLPPGIVSGNEIVISDNVFRNIFKFAELSHDDIFYHINFGKNINALRIATEEFNVKKVVGVDWRKVNVEKAFETIDENINKIKIIESSVDKIEISPATVVFFWDTNSNLIKTVKRKLEKELKNGARVITILSPPELMLPTKTEFPFIMCKKPFNYASNIQEQIKAIYGSSCIDFTASWLLSERYIQKMETQGSYTRFVNMLMSMIIWINAWNMKVACEDEIPPPVESYIGILRTFFSIDLSEMIVKRESRR